MQMQKKKKMLFFSRSPLRDRHRSMRNFTDLDFRCEKKKKTISLKFWLEFENVYFIVDICQVNDFKIGAHKSA